MSVQDTIREFGEPALATLDGLDVEHQSSPDPQLNEALERLVQLRDALIERRRAGEDCGGWLGRINALLSGLAAVEYPSGGIPWPRIQRVRDELREVLGAVDTAEPH